MGRDTKIRKQIGPLYLGWVLPVKTGTDRQEGPWKQGACRERVCGYVRVLLCLSAPRSISLAVEDVPKSPGLRVNPPSVV